MSLIEYCKWCIGHSMSMSKENRHAMLFLARYILVIDLLTLSIWIILKEQYTYPFIRCDRFEESAKSNVVSYIELHHKRNCHLCWLVLQYIMAKEESLPVGLWNVAFCTKKIWYIHVCIFLEMGNITCLNTFNLKKNPSYNVHFNMLREIYIVYLSFKWSITLTCKLNSINCLITEYTVIIFVVMFCIYKHKKLINLRCLDEWLTFLIRKHSARS